MSIVYKDGQRLYLNSWEYNAARIISKMAELIENFNNIKYSKTRI